MKEPDHPRVLVTGGSGFLGSHLCEHLLSRGADVLCVDNFYTGSKRNIVHLMESPYFELLRHDITFPLYVEVDQIYNLACPASPIHYQHDPVQTTEVYGDPTEHLQREGYWGRVNPIGLRACYDEGKRCAETFFFDYHRQHGLRIKVARIFNTYGPRMHPKDGRVVSNFIIQALTRRPITIYGHGGHTLSFCYVDDIVDGLVRMMNTPDHVTGPVNLGNPHETTILELAELIRELSASRSEIVFLPPPPDNPVGRRPDITLAREILGWEPVTPLAHGLRRTIDYFDDLLRRAPNLIPPAPSRPRPPNQGLIPGTKEMDAEEFQHTLHGRMKTPSCWKAPCSPALGGARRPFLAFDKTDELQARHHNNLIQDLRPDFHETESK